MKPTEGEIRKILNELYPIPADPTGGPLAQLQRSACTAFFERLDKYFEDADREKTANEIKVLEGIRSHLAKENEELKKKVAEQEKEIADLKTAKVEAEHKLADIKYRSENSERIIKNRTDAVMAEANKRIRDAVPIDTQEELNDYHKLLSSVMASEKQDLAQYSTRWRILTRRIIDMNMNSPRFALFARANGSYIMARWGNICALTGSPKCEDYDQADFTHYMTIPKTSLQYLLNGPSPAPDICEGCPHRITDPKNPNKCVLPDCIKDYTIDRYAAATKSTNNTEN